MSDRAVVRIALGLYSDYEVARAAYLQKLGVRSGSVQDLTDRVLDPENFMFATDTDPIPFPF